MEAGSDLLLSGQSGNANRPVGAIDIEAAEAQGLATRVSISPTTLQQNNYRIEQFQVVHQIPDENVPAQQAQQTQQQRNESQELSERLRWQQFQIEQQQYQIAQLQDENRYLHLRTLHDQDLQLQNQHLRMHLDTLNSQASATSNYVVPAADELPSAQLAAQNQQLQILLRASINKGSTCSTLNQQKANIVPSSPLVPSTQANDFDQLSWELGKKLKTTAKIKTAAQYAIVAVNRKFDCSKADAKEALQDAVFRLDDDYRFAKSRHKSEQSMLQGVREFNEYHRSKGSRNFYTQYALNAAGIAVSFSDNSNGSGVARAAGVSKTTADRWKEKAAVLKETGQPIQLVPRKQRSDTIHPLLRLFYQTFVASDEADGTFVTIDKNLSRKSNCKVPVVTETEEGSGEYHIEREKTVEHTRKLPYGTLEDLREDINASSEFKEFKLRYGIDEDYIMSKSMLSRISCKCVASATEHSCVNTKTTGLEMMASDIADTLAYKRRNGNAVKKELSLCDCPFHSKDPEERVGANIISVLRARARKICKAMCCAQVEMPELAITADESVPKMTAWKCLQGDCIQCGPELFLAPLLKCPKISGCSTEIKVRVWKKNPRGKCRAQLEVDTKSIALNDAIDELCALLEDVSAFVAQDDRTKRSFFVMEEMFDEYTMLFKMDFGAVMSLKALLTANSSVNQQVVVENVVVLHSPRMVSVVNDDGQIEQIRVHDTDYWAFVHEPSKSVYKCNTSAGHFADLGHLIKHYKDLAEKKGKPNKMAILQTDRCSGQYMNEKVNYFTASMTDISFVHYYAQVSEFAGPHDCQSKRIVAHVNRMERRGFRITDGRALFESLVQNNFGQPVRDWAAFEAAGSIGLLAKKKYNCTRTFVAYVTQDEAEYKEMIACNPDQHIVFNDPTRRLPRTGTLEGTSTWDVVANSLEYLSKPLSERQNHLGEELFCLRTIENCCPHPECVFGQPRRMCNSSLHKTNGAKELIVRDLSTNMKSIMNDKVTEYFKQKYKIKAQPNIGQLKEELGDDSQRPFRLHYVHAVYQKIRDPSDLDFSNIINFDAHGNPIGDQVSEKDPQEDIAATILPVVKESPNVCSEDGNKSDDEGGNGGCDRDGHKGGNQNDTEDGIVMIEYQDDANLDDNHVVDLINVNGTKHEIITILDDDNLIKRDACLDKNSEVVLGHNDSNDAGNDTEEAIDGEFVVEPDVAVTQENFLEMSEKGVYATLSDTDLLCGESQLNHLRLRAIQRNLRHRSIRPPRKFEEALCKLQEYVALLRPLNDDQQRCVDDAIYGEGGDTEIIVRFQKQPSPVVITRGSIHRLKPGVWLNDEVINGFLHLIQTEVDRCYIFGSFFMTTLLNVGHPDLEGTYSYDSFKRRRWSNSLKSLFDYDKVFFPINITGFHWMVVVVSIESQTIRMFDSSRGNGKPYLQHILRFLQDHHMALRETPLPRGWKLIDTTVDTPFQTNGYDCGVFVCMFVDYLSRDLPLDFCQAHIPQLRNRIALSILKGKVLTSLGTL